MTTTHPVASREGWMVARLALLDADDGFGMWFRRHDEYPDR